MVTGSKLEVPNWTPYFPKSLIFQSENRGVRGQREKLDHARGRYQMLKKERELRK